MLFNMCHELLSQFCVFIYDYLVIRLHRDFMKELIVSWFIFPLGPVWGILDLLNELLARFFVKHDCPLFFIIWEIRKAC